MKPITTSQKLNGYPEDEALPAALPSSDTNQAQYKIDLQQLHKLDLMVRLKMVAAHSHSNTSPHHTRVR